jgi:hypothetical protein
LTASLPPPTDPAINPTGAFFEAWWRFFRELLDMVTTLVSDLAALGAKKVWTTVIKLADEAIVSDTTFSDDGEIEFPVLENTKYAFRIVAFYETPAAADFKWSLGGPAAPTLVRYRARQVEFGVARTDVEQTAFGISSAMATGAATAGMVDIQGIVHVGASAGSIRLRWAQNTSDVGQTIVRAGSFIEAIQVQ